MLGRTAMSCMRCRMAGTGHTGADSREGCWPARQEAAAGCHASYGLAIAQWLEHGSVGAHAVQDTAQCWEVLLSEQPACTGESHSSAAATVPVWVVNPTLKTWAQRGRLEREQEHAARGHSMGAERSSAPAPARPGQRAGQPPARSRQGETLQPGAAHRLPRMGIRKRRSVRQLSPLLKLKAVKLAWAPKSGQARPAPAPHLVCAVRLPHELPDVELAAPLAHVCGASITQVRVVRPRHLPGGRVNRGAIGRGRAGPPGQGGGLAQPQAMDPWLF